MWRDVGRDVWRDAGRGATRARRHLQPQPLRPFRLQRLPLRRHDGHEAALRAPCSLLHPLLRLPASLGDGL
eukprot:4396531-Prymnesium_polylepis.2